MTAELTRAAMQQRMTRALHHADIATAGLDARLLLLAALGIDETSLARSPETVLASHERARAEGFFCSKDWRIDRSPKSLAKKEFWGVSSKSLMTCWTRAPTARP